MGSGPDEIENLRRQVDASREQLGNTVAALAYKVDVKHRGQEVINAKKETVMEKVEELRSKLPSGDDVAGKVGDMKSRMPSGEDVSGKVSELKEKLPDAAPSADEVKGAMHDHPVAVAAGAAAAGFVAGVALPQTQIEREKLNPTAQQVRAEVQGRVQDAVEEAKGAAQDAASSVAGAIRQQGEAHGGRVGDAAAKAGERAEDRIPG